MADSLPLSQKDDDLSQFAGFLTPAKDFWRESDEMCVRIFKYLSKHLSYIDRIVIAGSLGMKTALRIEKPKTAINLVIYVNLPKSKSPLPSSETYKSTLRPILSDIKHMLSLCGSELGDFKIGELTEESLKFQVDKQDVEVFPAQNLATPGNRRSQHTETLNRIRSSINPIEEHLQYTNAFAEASVAFMKKQSYFVKSVLRLAKFWVNKVTNCEDTLYLVQLVAIHNAKKHERKQDRLIFSAFEEFLMQMKEFDEVEVMFYNYYKMDDIPPSVRWERPLILDPVNPYSNLANGISPTVKCALEDRASTTLFLLNYVGQKSLEDII